MVSLKLKQLAVVLGLLPSVFCGVINTATCDNANSLYKLLKSGVLKDAATSFCSSYLGSPRTTSVTVTVPSTVIAATTSNLPDVRETTIATTTNTLTITTTVVLYSAVPTITTVTTVTAPTSTVYTKAGGPVKRQKLSGIFSVLNAFASPKISSACSCIITVETQTVSQTETIPTTISTTVIAPATATVVITDIVTLGTTVEASTLTTAPATSTETTTSTSTFTPIAYAPATCNINGYPNDYAVDRVIRSNFDIDHAGCGQFCLSIPGCLEYGWYQSPPLAGVCRLFGAPVALGVEVNPRGYYIFSDRACAQ